MQEPSDSELHRFAEEMREHTKKRQQMRRALTSVTTPLFRRTGFTGACPHFRRLGPARYDLFMFDFCKGYDGFSIQLGQCTPDDIGDIPRDQLAAFFALRPREKLNPEYLRLNQRARVQPRHGILPGDFFEYGHARTPEDYRRVALSALPFVEKSIAGFDDFARFAQTEKLNKGNLA